MRESAKHRLMRLLGLLACAAVLAFGIGCGSKDVVEAPSHHPSVESAASSSTHENESHESTPSPKTETAPAQSAEVIPNDSNLIVRFLDVGQGDSALITCGGQSLLIDGGPSSASSKLFTILRNLGIQRLDCIIVTHPDADHCGGVAGALNYASCDRFYCSVTEHDTKTFQSVLRYLGDTPVTVPTPGESFDLGDATVEFVAPVYRTNDSNEDSLVCKIAYGSKSFLFTGDAGFESESMMLRGDAPIDVDVLKVGHHGSKSATSASFLSRVTPEYAIISVGDNGYGHPTDAVLQRLANTNAQILRTDELGTITIETDGNGFLVSHSKGAVER